MSGAAKLAPGQEALLALVVREAVTNVMRHASATNCQLSLIEALNGWRLLIADDGRGGAFQEGNGLRGMRERVEGVGGICFAKAATVPSSISLSPAKPHRKLPHEADSRVTR